MKTTFAVCLALALVAASTCIFAPRCIEYYDFENGGPCRGKRSLEYGLVTMCCEDSNLYPTVQSNGGYGYTCTCQDEA
ncbi:hypothetical protein RRG08_008607 [Elysia crispata]|uniref:Plethodontid modulating factor n=1 Tax=Elysia crispata TaxID=231223 RepID=A0AAE1EBG1_9GAST|nr:hypothetical protein RRG08_008607 [Elysia crispata]